MHLVSKEGSGEILSGVLNHAAVKPEAVRISTLGIYYVEWLCNSINGRKIIRLKSKETMYKTDESDLGTSDNNPPSMGGRHAFNLLIHIT